MKPEHWSRERVAYENDDGAPDTCPFCGGALEYEAGDAGEPPTWNRPMGGAPPTPASVTCMDCHACAWSPFEGWCSLETGDTLSGPAAERISQ